MPSIIVTYLSSQTSATLSMCVYVLSQNTEIAKKLREEIIGKVGKARPTYDDIRDMKYLRAFLNGTIHP
jgi:hypothetical protein